MIMHKYIVIIRGASHNPRHVFLYSIKPFLASFIVV